MACSRAPADAPATAPRQPIPLAQLARVAERELDAIRAVQLSEADAVKALNGVASTLSATGLTNGIPPWPTPNDIEGCFRKAATLRGLQITAFKPSIPPLVPAKPTKLKPGERWPLTVDALVASIPVEVVVNGPLPLVAGMIDEVSQCERLIAVRRAKVVGNVVTLSADSWFERSIAIPELDLHWRSLDERLVAAGWKPGDPALAKDPAFGQLRAAVDMGREQLPRTRDVIASSAELPRWIIHARKLAALKQEIAKIRGDKVLGLNDASGR